MLIGFEQEFFLMDSDGNIVAVPSPVIPHDSCGWLAEARGEPFGRVDEAVFSLALSVRRIEKKLQEYGVTLLCQPWAVVSKSVRLATARQYAKGVTSYQNLYGHAAHRNVGLQAVAGIHISFTYPEIHTYGVRFEGSSRVETHEFRFNRMWDYPSMFRLLDQEFATEINASRRRPGFYELKPDGRVEYRSLPNNIPNDQLIDRVSFVIAKFNAST